MNHRFWRTAAALIFSLMSASPSWADASYFHKIFAGQIGGRYAFTMSLKNVDGQLTGSYRYTGKREDIPVRGKINPAGAFTMDESDGAGKITGTFAGTVVGGTFEGTWTPPGGKRSLTVEAHQTSEIIIGSKREILTKAIGTYVLDSISGSGGANTMWESWRKNGTWTSNVSSIEQARREFSDVDLSHDDLRVLNGMMISVDASLATHLAVGNKVLLTIPYRDAGMQYEINQPHDSTVEEDLAKMSPSTTVLDERLYLLARDATDLAQSMSGNFLPLEHADIAILDYSVTAKAFEVYLRDGNCCDGAVFRFVRQRR